MADKANHHALVDPAWVEERLGNTKLRILDCSAEARTYEQNHIPGALRLDWDLDLTTPQTRDLISKDEFEQLARRLGIANDTTVVFYDNLHSLGACHTYWVFRFFGHDQAKILNGGRQRWESERRTLTREVPKVMPASYKVKQLYPELRALRQDVLRHIGSPDPAAPRFQIPTDHVVLDDRSPAEFDGQVETAGDYPVRTVRGGRIPGALNIPFSDFIDKNGAFRESEEIKKFLVSKGVTPDKDIVVYTRIGERSAMTWFVLHDLLGYPKVRNYDGAFTEWGNMVGMPVEHAARLAGPRIAAMESKEMAKGRRAKA